ncbi:ABC-2 type transport system permease protein [Aneurinibacillus soli]|uniref:ABC-2 family transporter protein n=2 Tax=Aneurinibacillus soli TaxID=1500254 RepID=A0A0U5B4I2_9BACL|nr:ABC transporter permease [Aneurinibacillus soli]PYE64370.1 ABC-2 type transport system permease protein [Aneurinibacillus soli]BAU28319.1 ABC-2 family transporter protein [Aneurinibacillus soli]
MLNLLLNENMKIYRRMRTWMLVVALVLTTIGFLTAQHFTVKPAEVANASWKTNIQQQIKNDQRMLTVMNRGNDWKARVTSRINVNQYHLTHNLPPTDETLWGNILKAADLVVVVTVFTVVIAADSVAGEFSSGTIKLLLIRPVSRSKILLSKYVSTVVFSVLLLLILFISAFIVSGVLQGFHDIGVPYVYASGDGVVHTKNIVQEAISTYLYQCVQMIITVTMAFMISTVFRSSSIAIALSVGIMFAGSSIVSFLSQFSWAKYYLFENTDLTQYLNGTPNIPGMTLSFSITVILGYFLTFIALSWIVFKKRDIAA